MHLLTEPHDTYLATSHAWGSSSARRLLTSPRLAKDHMDGLVARIESAAFSLGTAWHTMLTGVGEKHIVRPAEIDGRTKEGKAWLAQHADDLILTAEQDEILHRMYDRMPEGLSMMPFAWKAAGQAEGVARVQRAGYAIQARPDLFVPAAGGQPAMLVDIKTTGKPIEAFGRSAMDYGYPFQAGWYRMVCAEYLGIPAPSWQMLVTETVAPWRTVLFVPDSDWIAYGDAQAAQAAEILATCYATGDWSDKTEPTQILTLPKWAGSPAAADSVPAFGD